MIPVTGGIFTVTITHVTNSITTTTITTSTETDTDAKTAIDNSTVAPTVTETLLWDRKAEGGFPETKELKNRVRNIIEPGRDLGHIDRSLKKSQAAKGQGTNDEQHSSTVGGEGKGAGALNVSTEIAHGDEAVGTGPDAETKAKTEASAKCEDCA